MRAYLLPCPLLHKQTSFSDQHHWYCVGYTDSTPPHCTLHYPVNIPSLRLNIVRVALNVPIKLPRTTSKTSPADVKMTAPAQVGRQMTITDLRIHPIKSCRGISVKSAHLTRKGLQYDRQWMFVDAANKFMTIRGQSEMTLINTSINHISGNLEITFPARPESGLSKTTISVPLDPTTAWLEANCEKLNVEIWEFNTDAWTYTDPSIHEPVTNYFRTIDPSSNARLVVKGPTPRPTGGNGSKELLGREESVNFPDVLPIQVASEVSLAELNSRLEQRNEKAITVERFRPNIIVTGDDLVPWEEDEWRLLRVNPPKTTWGTFTSLTGVGNESIDMDVSARCARCQVPNVNPDTAEKHPKEPWSVLYSYRRVDEGMKVKPCFGMLCCPRNEGKVEIGMTVEVREVMAAAGGKGKHRYVKGF